MYKKTSNDHVHAYAYSFWTIWNIDSRYLSKSVRAKLTPEDDELAAGWFSSS